MMNGELAMSSCDTCLWEHHRDCVSESLDKIAEDSSFKTCNCVGWLRKDFEEHFINTYEEIVNLLDRRKSSELEEVLEFIKNQRVETCSHKNRKFDLANEICIGGKVYADTYCMKCGKLVEEKIFLCNRR